MNEPQKILVIGASGVLGSHVVEALKARGHSVIEASRHSSEVSVDTTDSESIETMYEKVGSGLDAVVCAAGTAPFSDLQDCTYDQMLEALQGKGISQLDIVRLGQKYIKKDGSFTLITGILTDVPLKNSQFAAAANGMVTGFVQAAAPNLQQRINAVSPTVLTESMEKYADAFMGFVPVDAAEAAQYYVRSVEGVETGQIFTVGY